MSQQDPITDGNDLPKDEEIEEGEEYTSEYDWETDYVRFSDSPVKNQKGQQIGIERYIVTFFEAEAGKKLFLHFGSIKALTSRPYGITWNPVCGADPNNSPWITKVFRMRFYFAEKSDEQKDAERKERKKKA